MTQTVAPSSRTWKPLTVAFLLEQGVPLRAFAYPLEFRVQKSGRLHRSLHCNKQKEFKKNPQTLLLSDVYQDVCEECGFHDQASDPPVWSDFVEEAADLHAAEPDDDYQEDSPWMERQHHIEDLLDYSLGDKASPFLEPYRRNLREYWQGELERAVAESCEPLRRLAASRVALRKYHMMAFQVALDPLLTGPAGTALNDWCSMVLDNESAALEQKKYLHLSVEELTASLAAALEVHLPLPEMPSRSQNPGESFPEYVRTMRTERFLPEFEKALRTLEKKVESDLFSPVTLGVCSASKFAGDVDQNIREILLPYRSVRFSSRDSGFVVILAPEALFVRFAARAFPSRNRAPLPPEDLLETALGIYDPRSKTLNTLTKTLDAAERLLS